MKKRRLIDADLLMEYVKQNVPYLYPMVGAAILMIPPAEEEVVYCKDCIFQDTSYCQIQNALYGLDDYDSCSYGYKGGEKDDQSE